MKKDIDQILRQQTCGRTDCENTGLVKDFCIVCGNVDSAKATMIRARAINNVMQTHNDAKASICAEIDAACKKISDDQDKKNRESLQEIEDIIRQSQKLQVEYNIEHAATEQKYQLLFGLKIFDTKKRRKTRNAALKKIDDKYREKNAIYEQNLATQINSISKLAVDCENQRQLTIEDSKKRMDEMEEQFRQDYNALLHTEIIRLQQEPYDNPVNMNGRHRLPWHKP